MRKIPTLFCRDEQDRRYVTRDVTPGCEWVLAGEGRATRKWDGTCVCFDGDKWWTRREVKPGKDAPPGFVKLDFDPVTGKTVGWEPAEQSSFWRYLSEAIGDDRIPAGTYELCGPKINGNPERRATHELLAHGAVFADPPQSVRTYDDLVEFFCSDYSGMEGIVFWRGKGASGDLVKIKRRDFRELA